MNRQIYLIIQLNSLLFLLFERKEQKTKFRATNTQLRSVAEKHVRFGQVDQQHKKKYGFFSAGSADCNAI